MQLFEQALRLDHLAGEVWQKVCRFQIAVHVAPDEVGLGRVAQLDQNAVVERAYVDQPVPAHVFVQIGALRPS